MCVVGRREEERRREGDGWTVENENPPTDVVVGIKNGTTIKLFWYVWGYGGMSLVWLWVFCFNVHGRRSGVLGPSRVSSQLVRR